MWVFGKGYQQKNLFQQYFIEIIKAVEAEDIAYLNQLLEELTEEQWHYIWKHLASYTRSWIQEAVRKDRAIYRR